MWSGGAWRPTSTWSTWSVRSPMSAGRSTDHQARSRPARKESTPHSGMPLADRATTHALLVRYATRAPTSCPTGHASAIRHGQMRLATATQAGRHPDGQRSSRSRWTKECHHRSSKLVMRVRFPSPAPTRNRSSETNGRLRA